MFDFVRKNKKAIFTFTLTAFIGSIFIGFGAYLWEGGTTEAIFVINNKKVPIRRFHQVYRNVVANLRSSGEVNEETLRQTRNDVLHDLIREEAFYQYAVKFGIVVPDQEIAFNIASIKRFQRDGRFDPNLYYLFLRTMNMSPHDFEEMQRRQLMGMKLRKFIDESVLFTEDELLDTTLVNQKREAIFIEWFRQLQNNTQVRILKNIDELF